jgi:hypothetical protein
MLLSISTQHRASSSGVKHSHLLSAANDLAHALNNGTTFPTLGGKKLKKRPKLIRFRVGVYRIVFKRYQDGFVCKKILHRKELEQFLKRR